MSDIDVSTSPSEAIESEIATISAQIDAAEHRLLTLVRALDARQRHRDHGLPSMVAWLTWRVGLGPVAAREKVRAMTCIAPPESEGRLLHMAKNASASGVIEVEGEPAAPTRARAR